MITCFQEMPGISPIYPIQDACGGAVNWTFLGFALVGMSDKFVKILALLALAGTGSLIANISSHSTYRNTGFIGRGLSVVRLAF